MSQFPLLFLLLLLIPATQSVISYRFTFKENNLNNFFQVYLLDVGIDITFTDDDYAHFSTTVFNVTPLHFSMWINGVNCGIINLSCKFKIQPNQLLNIVMYKIDMQSNLISFLYRGGTQSPDIFINGCSKTMNALSCAYGSQYSTDTRGNSYTDSICVCRAIVANCLLVSNDTCISNRPFWNYNPSEDTTTQEPTTTRLITTVPITTTKGSTTREPTTVPTTTKKVFTTKGFTTVPTTTITTTTTSPTTVATTTVPRTTVLTTTTLATTTTITTTTTVTTPTTPTTATSTTSSPTTTVTNSTKSPSTSTTTPSPPPPTTTTTPDMFVPTLKNLSDSGVGPNNVSTVLNETLVYSKIGPDLNATQVMEISTILINAANVPGLKAENSMAILQNLDNMLYVNPSTMYQSGNSAQRVLDCLGTMVDNTMDPRIEYLDGTNLGFSSKKIDCSKLGQDDGLLDLGNRFELINSTDSLGKWHSIVVPSYTGTNLPISSGKAETYTPPPRFAMDAGFFRSFWVDTVGAEGEGLEMNVTSRELENKGSYVIDQSCAKKKFRKNRKKKFFFENYFFRKFFFEISVFFQ
ncbi:hypothetical protein CAEBREN_12631 [Caenorhabditis brenneri]|uniref:Uncharacterized protein n=1 Tax=Caenorhabditis brenneri TaxID=135651 RepID=G0MMZ4_CAEBE|nr:hypothetical protein CAEBREN_12631 [Caenorhabditis brenneri]